MILHALCEYYRRQEEELPPPGFERKAIPFVIVLDRDGRFVDIEDTRDGNNKRDKGRPFVVPQGVKRTSGVAANLLWDGLGYVLGVVSETRAAKLTPPSSKKNRSALAKRTACSFSASMMFFRSPSMTMEYGPRWRFWNGVISARFLPIRSGRN